MPSTKKKIEKRGGHNRRAISWNGKKYNSLRELTDSLGIQKGHLSWYLKTGKPFRGYPVSYIDPQKKNDYFVRIQATRKDINVSWSEKYYIKAESDRKAWAEARKKILTGRDPANYKTMIVQSSER